MKFIGCIFIALVCQILAEDDNSGTGGRSECIPGSWLQASNGDHPRGALVAGIDESKLLYVIRVLDDGELIPGKLHNKRAYIVKDNEEHTFSKYDVFCGGNIHWRWVPVSKRYIPPNSLIAGENRNTEPLYVCRGVVRENTFSVGKVEEGICHLGYDDRDYPLSEYDILVENWYTSEEENKE